MTLYQVMKTSSTSSCLIFVYAQQTTLGPPWAGWLVLTMHGVKWNKLTYFFIAAHLVAFVPISSAAVERLFSQVKFIVETLGVSVLEETTKTRLMERVERYP